MQCVLLVDWRCFTNVLWRREFQIAPTWFRCVWHQVGLLFFNYHNDARSNIHKILIFLVIGVETNVCRCTFNRYSVMMHLQNSLLESRCVAVALIALNFLKPTGHVMHQQFNTQQLYVLPTLYLCVLYLSENKQRLVPLTA